MRKRIISLALLVLLSGLTACGEGTSEPPAVPEDPIVSVDPSPTGKETELPEETPIELPPEYAAAVVSDGSRPTGECVAYYESPYGFLKFPNEESFIAAFGFEGEAPFFEHSYEWIEFYGEGEEHLCTDQTRLYYNEELGTGCVVQDSFYEGLSHKTGLVFEGMEPASEDEWGQWSRWEMEPYSIPGLEGVQNIDEVKDYQEYSEYDDEGRLISFRADGIFASPWSNEDGRNPVASLSLIYGEDGKLKERRMWRNDSLFGTYQSSQHCYYDELGRVCYEDCYVTHGREEFFYIYPDDGPAPAYCLYIDAWGGGAQFAQY